MHKISISTVFFAVLSACSGGEESPDTSVCDTTSPYVDCTRDGSADNGATQVVTYDDQGRTVARTFDNGNGVEVVEAWTYTDDRLTTYTNTSGDNTFEITYTYDGDRNLAASSDGWEYSYDDQGRQTGSVNDDNGDGVPEVTCTRDWAPSDTYWTYVETCEAYQSVDSVLLDPGTGRMLERELLTETPEGDVTDSYAYEWREDCQQVSYLQTSDAPGSLTTRYDYGYNDAGQLTTYVYNNGATTVEWALTYTCE